VKKLRISREKNLILRKIWRQFSLCVVLCTVYLTVIWNTRLWPTRPRRPCTWKWTCARRTWWRSWAARALTSSSSNRPSTSSTCTPVGGRATRPAGPGTTSSSWTSRRWPTRAASSGSGAAARLRGWTAADAVSRNGAFAGARFGWFFLCVFNWVLMKFTIFWWFDSGFLSVLIFKYLLSSYSEKHTYCNVFSQILACLFKI